MANVEPKLNFIIPKTTSLIFIPKVILSDIPHPLKVFAWLSVIHCKNLPLKKGDQWSRFL